MKSLRHLRTLSGVAVTLALCARSLAAQVPPLDLSSCLMVASNPAVDQSLQVATPDPSAHAPRPPGSNAARVAATLQQQPLQYQADGMAREDDGSFDLIGHVSLQLGEHRISADRIAFNPNTDDLRVTGPLHFSDPQLQLDGKGGEYTQAGSNFDSADFKFLQKHGFGHAEHLEMAADRKHARLMGAAFSSCPPPHATWKVTAREIELDWDKDVAIARGAKFELFDHRIVSLPYLSFPLEDERKSGLLLPDISTSGLDGLMVATPWYWNIAPNQDLTLTPTYYSLRGAALSAEYRRMSGEDLGNLAFEYLPNDLKDGQYQSNARYDARIMERLDLPNNTRLNIDARAVSDPEYLEDFTQGTQSTSTAFLKRDLSIIHHDDIWTLGASMTGYQTVDTINLKDPAQRPYIQLPRLIADAVWSPSKWPSLRTGFDSEVVDFTRDIGITGWRADAQPHALIDWSGAGWFLRPGAAWEITQYHLRPAASDQSLGTAASATRSLPILTLDTGLIFDRTSGSDGSRTVTFEPRAMYVYIPYRDQKTLPDFDSAAPDPNIIELFRPNRYVGLDRIGDANETILGLTSQLFDNASGTRYFSGTVGQAVYFSTPRVTLPTDALLPEPPLTYRRSGLIAEAYLSAYRNWNLRLNFASDPQLHHADQSEVALQYRSDASSVANLAYRYRSGQFQQLDGSVAWPIGTRWDIYARSVWSVNSPTSTALNSTRPTLPIENFLGFQFRGNCWSVRAVAQRSLTTRTITDTGVAGPARSNTGVSVQLELTGLSNGRNGVGTGNGVSTFLEQSIQGYSATTARP